MSEVDLPQRLARYSSADPSDKATTPELSREMLSDLFLEIRRIALTQGDTVALGRATRFPASDKKDDTRYDWFVRNCGDGCWELDALSPEILRCRLEDAICAELDWEVWERYVRVEQAEQQAITETCQAWASISVPDQKYSDAHPDDAEGGAE